MAKRKKVTAAQLVDWRLGHHIEAAGKMIAESNMMIADALRCIAGQMEADHVLQAAEVDLRREHLLSVLESKAVADRAAHRLMGMIPDGAAFVDLRREGKPPEDGEAARGPEWVKDVLAQGDAQTEKLS